jgi:ferritin-like protein
MTDYHESWDALPGEARDLHRALKSLQEEIEAVDWYHQRVVMAENEALRDVLAHNRDEEMEHAAMALEWLRRHMDGWNEKLRMYLFTESPLTAIEEEAGKGSAGSGGLGIGSLKGGA